jgi:hypothetical protein
LKQKEGNNMSQFSGKSDLADTIFMQKMYPMHPGKDNSPLISDEMECFNIFKEKTGGKIHQHFKLELNEYNIDYELQQVNNPNLLSKVRIYDMLPDGNFADREVYTYWGKEYKSLKEINKKGYYATRTIHFNTLLDIIPYYPYIVSFMSGGEDGKLFIVISGQSYVDHQEEEARKYGYSNEMTNYYRKSLQEHYVEVVKKYFSGTK